MARAGVFVCHCGFNIAGTVDVEKVAEKLGKEKDVVFSTTYKYMCSGPGQNLIKDAIKEHRLDKVVVAACSPGMHEETFRNVGKDAGLNPYDVEIANIREQCSWVHDDMEEATEKAIKIAKSALKKVLGNEPLEPVKVGSTPKVLVIGAGIAGIQAALDVADAGYRVVLVEKEASIGGHMAQLSETFPTLDCSQCILTPKMVAVERDPNIELMTYSEVIGISGYIGNFRVKIKKKPRYVDPEKCNLCGDCVDVCSVIVPNEFEMGLSLRKAIYLPFPQAVPSTYTLDAESCLGLDPIRCGKCVEVCEAEAINYDVHPEIVEEEVGAIIIATGYDLYPKKMLGEYGYGRYEDVINGLEFERMLSASGPTEGEIRRPSDGKIPKRVVFIQCAGSRDPDNHLPYCSKICCMYTAKHAMLYKHHVPDGEAYVFYIDIRAGGKNYEEFIHRAMEEDRIVYLRGKPSKVFKEGDKLVVWGVDTLLGEKIEVEADLVVLAMAITPGKGTEEIIDVLNCASDENGFLKEVHPKLRPVESPTPGIFLAGAAQAPKDIPETVAQASAAASKAISVIGQEYLYHEPAVAFSDEELCSGCEICVSVCPYGAISIQGSHADVNAVMCEGCGSCASACPSGAMNLKNGTQEQVFEMIHAILEEE